MPELTDLVTRAAADPAFLRRLREDPCGAARAAGVDASESDLHDLFGGGPAAETLQARLSFSLKSDPPKHTIDDLGYAGAGSMY